MPVEYRWWGLDRRSLLPAAVVVCVGLLLSVVLPRIDDAVAVNEIVRPGDRLDLGGGLTIAPPAGWEVLAGIKVGEKTTLPVPEDAADASVAGGGVTALIRVDTFDGTPEALLDQVNHTQKRTSNQPGFTVTAPPVPVETAEGNVGVLERYTSTSGEGLLAAFTFHDGRGMSLSVAATGDGQLAEQAGRIERMIRSIRFTGKAATP
ncbi:hypothetical protein GCM10010468_14420 [Actinocorallia longicatena]|uniref:Uncharacterized protein n=1 Tax=Actinocorallia longicatena TaxID=111803 RepID=A0ABP6Q2C7_9ACTN